MKKILYGALALGAMFSFASCDLNVGRDYSELNPNAVVTLKTSDAGVFYMQLDDETTLKPENLAKNPYGKEVRALINFEDWDLSEDPGFDIEAEINWIDTVRTKKAVPSAGLVEDNDKKYGTAEIDIYNNWVTVLEDDYLTLSFSALWMDNRLYHDINLVYGVDPEDPYLVELRNNPMDDTFYYNGYRYNGIIAFNLDELPVEGEIDHLKIRYETLAGVKQTIEIKRNTDYFGLYTDEGRAAVKSAAPTDELLIK